MSKETKKKIQVSSLVLTIGNKEISLTPEEARELKLELERVLGRTDVVYKNWYSQPYIWPLPSYDQSLPITVTNP